MLKSKADSPGQGGVIKSATIYKVIKKVKIPRIIQEQIDAEQQQNGNK